MRLGTLREQKRRPILIFALNRSTLVTLLVLAVLAVVCVPLLFDQSATATEIWSRRGVVLLVLNLLIAALCIRPVFRVVHLISFGKTWLFPMLDGEWEAEIRSNWPRIKHMYGAARDGGPAFDAMRTELSDSELEESVTRAKVTIASNLLTMSLRLEPHASARISRTRFVRAEWRKPDMPEISYVYEQDDPGPVAATDARRHFGAGILRYDEVSDTLAGDYWTQRREDAGFNTAGSIILRRVD